MFHAIRRALPLISSRCRRPWPFTPWRPAWSLARRLSGQRAADASPSRRSGTRRRPPSARVFASVGTQGPDRSHALSPPWRGGTRHASRGGLPLKPFRGSARHVHGPSPSTDVPFGKALDRVRRTCDSGWCPNDHTERRRTPAPSSCGRPATPNDRRSVIEKLDKMKAATSLFRNHLLRGRLWPKRARRLSRAVAW